MWVRSKTTDTAPLTHKDLHTAMTPTPTVLLLVALFWTLPTSAAVLTYRAHDSSIENVKTALQRSLESAFSQPELQPQTDA